LQSSLSTAVELGGRPLRTAFEQLAVEVAEARAAAIDPLAPFPFETPRATRAALALAALFALTLLIPPRAHVAGPTPQEEAPEEGPLLEPEVLAAFEDELREELAPETSAE